MKPHWAVKYLGIPWVKAGDNIAGFDCWGLVRWVQREEFGIEVSVITVDASNLRAVLRAFTESAELQNWTSVSEPVEGDAVLMSHAKYPAHCGVWVPENGGGVLHCAQGFGVVFQSVPSLKASGWGKLEFFRHQSKLHGQHSDLPQSA